MTFIIRICVKTSGFFLCFPCKSGECLTTVSTAKKTTKHIAVFLIAFDINCKQLLKKIDKLKGLYINDIITMEELKRDKEKYMKELEDLPRNQDQKDLAPIKKLLKMDLDSIYKTLDPAERRQLWRSVVREIRIDDHKNLKIIFL